MSSSPAPTRMSRVRRARGSSEASERGSRGSVSLNCLPIVQLAGSGVLPEQRCGDAAE